MLIDCIELSKKFGTKIILDNVSFSIKKNDKIAIIGKNGAGKSSLFKIITNELEQDSGRIIIKNGIKIAALKQEIQNDLNIDVKSLIYSQLDEIFTLLKEYENLNKKLSQNHENQALLKEISIVCDKIESKDAWNIENKIQKVIEELELGHFLTRNANTLSGGEIRRVMLACMLLQNPDILLLDEPTNHLDVRMCEFLENYLKASKMCVVFISHDRYFIENVAQKCLELENGILREFLGGYSSYLKQKSELLASLLKSHETLVKQLKSEEEWLRRGVKARLKRNEGRKERIMQMREKAKQNPGILNRLKMEIMRASKIEQKTITKSRKKQLFMLENVSIKFGDKTLLDDFSVRILQGEKIAVVGENGCGKSSFLKCLLGENEISSGKLQKADIKIGYFSQNKNYEDVSLIEFFCPNGGDHILVHNQNMHVYGYLKKFLFPPEYLTYKMGSLSGGERTKVALAKLFTQEYELLILDEPTNDLDIATINILEDFLLNYKGALIIVSHDRYFIDRLCDKLFAFENGKISIENISYSEYLELQNEIKQISKNPEKIEKTSQNKDNENNKKNKKITYKQQKILDEYPEKIEKLETQISDLEYKLSTPSEYEKYGINALSKDLDELKNKLNELESVYFATIEQTC